MQHCKSTVFSKTNKKILRVSQYLKGNCQEKEMANHSSILARKISWTEEPSMLHSMRSKKKKKKKGNCQPRPMHKYLGCDESQWRCTGVEKYMM